MNTTIHHPSATRCRSKRGSERGSGGESVVVLLNADRAVQRAQVQLASDDTSGTVTVNGDRVTVNVSATVDYLVLPGSRTVTASATTTAVEGINTAGG